MRNGSNMAHKLLSVALSLLIVIAAVYIIYLNNNPQVKEVEIQTIVTVEKETIVEVEKVVTTEVYIEAEPTPHYKITNVEREMLARLLYREAGAASLECQKMVISVIFNRYDAANGEKTLEEIIYQKGQFQPAHLISSTTPTELNYQAVDEVVMNGVTIPYYVKYFRANYHFNWDGYVGYANLDGTYFGYMSNDVF